MEQGRKKEKNNILNVKKIYENSGVTLIALIVTVVVLLIISGITIKGAIDGQKEAVESVAISEIGIVQHAILERNTKASLTGETLPGTDITVSDVNKYISSQGVSTIKLKNTDGYKTLNKSQLEDLGISNSDETYIVNYETGEVLNYTRLVTEAGNVLYTYSVDKTVTN